MSGIFSIRNSSSDTADAAMFSEGGLPYPGEHLSQTLPVYKRCTRTLFLWHIPIQTESVVHRALPAIAARTEAVAFRVVHDLAAVAVQTSG